MRIEHTQRERERAHTERERERERESGHEVSSTTVRESMGNTHSERTGEGMVVKERVLRG